MNFKNLFIGFAVIAQVATAASAIALVNPRMIDRYRGQLQETTRDYVNVWVENKSQSAYQEPLQKMLRQHSMLVSYGIDLNDDVLVSHLYVDKGNTVSLQVFASRIFFHHLGRKLGWQPEKTAPLREKDYRIRIINSHDPLAEGEFKLTLP